MTDDVAALVAWHKDQADFARKRMTPFPAQKHEETAAALTRLGNNKDWGAAWYESRNHWKARAEKAEAALAEAHEAIRQMTPFADRLAERDKRIAALETELAKAYYPRGTK